MNINFFAFLFFSATILFTGEALGKTQYLPDASYNFNARLNDGYGGHPTSDNCATYGLTTCQGQEILRPGAVATHPIPGLNCYKESDCICPANFIYDETNCYNVVNQTKKSAAGGLLCDGKADSCHDKYSLKYYLVKNGVSCGNNESCSGCPENTIPQDDGSLSFINAQTGDYKVDFCTCLQDDYPLEAPLEGGECDNCVNSDGDISYRCVCKAGYKCTNPSADNASSLCESGCERDCPAPVSCDTGRREVKSTKEYCEDITVDCCPLAVEDCDHGCKKRSDQNGCEDLCIECRSRPETTGAIRLAFEIGAEDLKLTLPASGSNLNVDIDWGDGTTDYEVKSAASHTYAAAGSYEIKISGYAERIQVASSDKNKLKELRQLNLSSVTDIGAAFSGATNLSGTIPQLPPKLRSGYRAFEDCTELTGDVPQLPDSLTNVEWMFSGCSGLDGSIPLLPPEITSGNYMFVGCSGLTGDIPPLPDKLVSGAGMFAKCSKLSGKLPKFPESLEDGSEMFSRCSGLEGDIPQLPDSLTNGGFMFYQCRGLNGKITGLGSGLTNGHYMFAGCSGLTGDVPQLPDGLTSANGMFVSCSNLDGKIAGFGNGLTTASSMFQGCGKLSGSIPALPENLQNGSQMFQNCSSLTGNIPELPQSLTNGAYMFASCSNLTGKLPEFPQSLQAGGNMFSGCSGLTGDVPPLPDSLTSAARMFLNCSNLDGKITSFGKGLTTASSMFQGCGKLSGSIPALPENLQAGSLMFSNCGSLTGNIPELPQSLTNGAYMFAGCSGLTGVTPVNGLYPHKYLTQITSYSYMVRNCSESVRKHFPVSWGGLIEATETP